MQLNVRSYRKELLDSGNIPYHDLAKNLNELETINRFLGGHSITIKGLKKLITSKEPITILDLGSGGGDTLRAIALWARSNKVAVKLIGVDLKNECIHFAEKRSIQYPEISFIQSDFRDIELFNIQPDIIISSLFCHHLTNEEIIDLLKWMLKTARIGFVINDLHRHYMAYKSIALITALFSKSYLVKNDAKLSVARGFLKNEWKQLLALAGVGKRHLSWRWAFRHLIVVKNNDKN
ncbi:methyltransferase domain-containing protein [Solitalea lacus]|uniref:methyltransferase domain-containing protein n=1 Tax=Solitalea lacus TaxID=2911172 RepID=UPI001EDA7911|nr:methyltransferase domain-containing protein [Solitalea lacus]UKJ07308.1 methyltransferase domain-containing protein [Solitalea lacus]